MSSISYIFEQLPKAEVILTFSIDAMLNYLTPKREIAQTAAQFGVDKRFLDAWSVWKNDENAGRGVAQRTIMDAIHRFSRAAFFTPFMIFSEHDNRWIMIAHLSQSQAARDKMLTVHWDKRNTFRHIGPGGQFEIGYDARVVDGDALFSFSDLDSAQMFSELEADLPSRFRQLIPEAGLTVSDFLTHFGNKTAARNDQLFDVLTYLAAHNEFEVLSDQGARRRPGTKVRVGDKLIRPKQPQLFMPPPRKR